MKNKRSLHQYLKIKGAGFRPAHTLPILVLFFCSLQLPAQDDFRVMTFNIRYSNPGDGINSWDNRKAFLVRDLDSLAPDLVGMQEVLKSQLDYLTASLAGYRAVGVGRDDGRTGGEYSPVLFKTNRFSVSDWGTFWLSPTPNDTGSVGWDAALTRICTWVRFTEKLSGFEFYFLNTHFDHMGDNARTESAKLITDFISEHTRDYPVILTGDFNSTPEDSPYRLFCEPGSGLRDICRMGKTFTDCNEGTFNGFGSEKDPKRIDMIFVKGRWEPGSFSVLKLKQGDMFISDHWPVMAVLKSQQSAVSGQQSMWSSGDTTFVKTFTFDSIVTRRAVFQFPEKGKRYEKILMYYTLKCDSLTPHDKYPCGEWDYTTYTRVYHPTGIMDSIKYSQPGIVVKGKSPAEYYYSNKPTYTYFYSYPEENGEEEMRGKGEEEKTGGMLARRNDHSHEDGEADYFARFEGADYISVPGWAFKNVKDGFTVSFWLNGDPFHQPMASTVFEGLDAEGKRVVNLHIPYDNGVVYWDAGGHGEGLTDNIYKAARPIDYKGRWTHWVVTKNSLTGEQRIYMNGKLFQKGTGLKRTMEGITTFRIGANGMGNGKFYYGSMDDFAAWDRELDSTEIVSLINEDIKDYPKQGMLFAYDFNEPSAVPVIHDISGNNNSGLSFGNPSVIPFSSLPYAGYKPRPGQAMLVDSIVNPLVTIIFFGDSLQPSLPSDTLAAWPGYDFYGNSQGLIIDSAMVEGAIKLTRKTRSWYGKPFEIIEPFEIGRFITPYGKRLDLGLHGFTWIYDVTGYEPLLHGPVDLQAANGQELLDLRFLFIEGVPPRDVIDVKNIWPEGSYKYKDLADGKALKPVNIMLDSTASSFMVRARISGHGEYGPQACCEWSPKTHSYFINGKKEFSWKVWRDCGMNPVYPQGGTWQFDRAGWCPGTFVDTYDFEITPYVKPGNMVNIGYGIDPYDPDNGEEKGNFEMAMQLFEFTAPNYRIDLELNDILSPSTRQEYRRMNPISLNPVVRVKNTGSDTIRSFTVVYGLEGNPESSYEWTGKLAFMQSADVILPKPSWRGMSENSLFTARIEKVNGIADENLSNNSLSSAVDKPVILPSKFYIHVKTQGFGRAADNTYTITNEHGKIVSQRLVYADTTVYNDLVKLKPGAYDFTFTDKNEDGLIRHWWMYWEDKTQVGGNGELMILDADKKELLNLGYDFAEKRVLQFFVGEPE